MNKKLNLIFKLLVSKDLKLLVKVMIKRYTDNNKFLKYFQKKILQ